MSLLYAVVFFPVAHYISKLSGMNGLNDLGVNFHRGWERNLKIGFGIGSIFWLVMELIFLSYNSLFIVGMKSFSAGTFFMVQAFIGMFLSSFINDIIVRGYVFARLKHKVSNISLLLISALIYVLNDSWYEGLGFSLYNSIFSVALGLTLGYVFLRTGSLWATTGVHWGLNVVYCIFYGIPGHENEGGLLIVERYFVNSFFINNLSVIVSVLMFAFVLLFYKRLKFNTIGKISNDKKDVY